MNIQENIRRILREDIKNHKPLEGLFSVFINGELITGKVRDLIRYSKKYPVTDLNLNDIPDIPHHQEPETNIYTMNANLKYPIIVMVNDNDEVTRVLDGNHRIQKALYLGNKTINAKLIPEKDIMELLGKTNIQENIRKVLREELLNETKIFHRRIKLNDVKALLKNYAHQVYHETSNYDQFKYELTLKSVESIMWMDYGIGWEDLPEEEEIEFVTKVSDMIEDNIKRFYDYYKIRK